MAFCNFFRPPPFRLALAAEGEERGRAQGRAGAIRRRGGAAAFGGPGAFGPPGPPNKSQAAGPLAPAPGFPGALRPAAAPPAPPDARNGKG